MDKEKIIALARRMQTKEDLLALLNLLKKEDMKEMGCADQFYPFTIQHITYFCNPNHAFHRYKQFKIKKKSGGSRLITAPNNRSFKLILRYVNEIFKAMYTPSDYAMGFTEGRSVVHNAALHRGKNYVFNIDMKDFFPSIDQARVWKRLQLAPFNFSQSIANILAGLCAMRLTIEEEGTKEKRYSYVLPQGAPTSPIITNMICDNLDRRLAGVAKRFGLSYSRYADDITFSSMHNVYQKNGEFRTELRRIIKQQGFTVNENKTRLQKIGSRQEVTGLIVCEKLNVTKNYVNGIRNLLYIWDRYGYNIAYGRFVNQYKEEKGHVKHGVPDMINVLDGKLLYLKMVKGEEDSVYKRLYGKFSYLMRKMQDPEHVTSHQITYMDTMPVLDFEKKQNTKIYIAPASTYTIYKKDENDPSQMIEITKEKGRYAYFMLSNKKIKASINKSVKSEDEQDKARLAISSCLDPHGKPFWLIHKVNKVTVPPPKEVDVDELIGELDTLLIENHG